MMVEGGDLGFISVASGSRFEVLKMLKNEDEAHWKEKGVILLNLTMSNFRCCLSEGGDYARDVQKCLFCSFCCGL